MEKYIPDMYEKNIYSIDYESLKNRGIKCILFDLDNTLVPYNKKTITKKLQNLVEELKEMDFKVIIFSNNTKKRVEPFKKALRVDCLVNAKKPFVMNYNKIIKIYKLNQSQVVMIGDKIVTDVLGGNKAGITTILVNPISVYDSFGGRILNKLERKIEKKLAENDLFKRGDYYER